MSSINDCLREDMVAVVRCIRCKNYSDKTEGTWRTCEQHHIITNNNDYCSYGKRRKDEERNDRQSICRGHAVGEDI